MANMVRCARKNQLWLLLCFPETYFYISLICVHVSFFISDHHFSFLVLWCSALSQCLVYDSLSTQWCHWVFMDYTENNRYFLLSSMCCTSEMFKRSFLLGGRSDGAHHGLEFYLCRLVICPNIDITMQQMLPTSTALKNYMFITETIFQALRTIRASVGIPVTHVVQSWQPCFLLQEASPPWFWEGGDLLYQPWVPLYHTQGAVSLRCSRSSGHLRMSANNKSDSEHRLSHRWLQCWPDFNTQKRIIQNWVLHHGCVLC